MDIQLKLGITQALLFILYMVFMHYRASIVGYLNVGIVYERIMHLQMLLILLHIPIGIVRLWML